MFDSWSATKNIAERALSTFLQTFMGSFGAVLILTPITDWLAFKTALGSSVGAALLSVRKNLTAEGIKAQAEKELVMTPLRDNRITER
jgi:hypothetical protein